MKFLLLLLLVSFHTVSRAQISYTGHYGSKESRKSLLERTPGIKVAKDESGYQSDLVIVNLKGDQYKFWLFISKGYPAYHSGNIEGLINIVNDTAVFYEQDTVIGIACRLIFSFSKANVYIAQRMEDNCGFGANVHAEGDYPRKSSRPTITDINNMYHTDMLVVVVAADKAFVYEHPTDTRASAKYFIKGDKLYGDEEEGDFLFVRFMSKNGRYTEGWIKKSTLR
jgi:hypothetical protein